MEYEFCIDSLEGALIADQFGADRVELCSALYEGGLTPSIGLVRSCVTHSKQAVFAMVRPEAGGFVYNKQQLEVMQSDIEAMAFEGVKGVVFGVLTSQNALDYESNALLVETARKNKLETVFHRAFDFAKQPFEVLEQLIELNIDRLLTSGQRPKAIEGIDLIIDLHKHAKGRIEIMAGSGVNAENVDQFLDTNIDAVHFTAVQAEREIKLGMGPKYHVNEEKVSSIMKRKR